MKKIKSALSIILLSALSICLTSGISNARNLNGWAEYISSHTSGMISKKSAIQIVFNEDMVKSINESAEGILTFKPHIKGVYKWKSLDEIVFTPKIPLSSGARIKAYVNIKRLKPETASLKPYSFKFSTIKQSFDLKVDGLSSVDDFDLSKKILKGNIVTADYADDMSVEKVIKASQKGDALPVEWKHHPHSKKHDHRFSR